MSGIKIYDSNTNNTLSLNWNSSIENLKKMCLPQQGPALWKNIDMSNDTEFFKNLEKIYQERWDKIYRFLNHKNKLSNSKVMLEIGSGVGIHALLLSQVYPDITFYLVDKNYYENDFRLDFYNEDHHGFYNDFSVTQDCIASSNLDPTKFKFLTPEDEWPNDIDIVCSFMSYCWHYGKKNYWDKIKTGLKNNGHLILDVNYESNAQKEISEEFGLAELRFEFKQFARNHNSSDALFKKNLEGTIGARFTWVRP